MVTLDGTPFAESALPLAISLAARDRHAVAIAVLSNTLVKGGLAILVGAPELRRLMAPAVAVILAAGVVGAILL